MFALNLQCFELAPQSSTTLVPEIPEEAMWRDVKVDIYPWLCASSGLALGQDGQIGEENLGQFVDGSSKLRVKVRNLFFHRD